MSQGGKFSCLGCPKKLKVRSEGPGSGETWPDPPCWRPFSCDPTTQHTWQRKMAQTHGQRIIQNSKAQVIYSLQSQKNAFLHLAFGHTLIVTSVEGVTSWGFRLVCKGKQENVPVMFENPSGHSEMLTRSTEDYDLLWEHQSHVLLMSLSRQDGHSRCGVTGRIPPLKTFALPPLFLSWHLLLNGCKRTLKLRLPHSALGFWLEPSSTRSTASCQDRGESSQQQSTIFRFLWRPSATKLWAEHIEFPSASLLHRHGQLG